MRFQTLLASVISLVSFSTAATAQDDFDWTQRANQLQVHRLLNMTATACSEYGFEVVQAQTEDTAARRVESQLLLSPNRDSTLRYWIKLRSDTTINERTVSEQDIERAVDGVSAAAADPANYARGETLYIEMMSKPLKKALAACQLGSSDEFISTNYWRGSGSMDALTDRLKEMFAASVQQEIEFRHEDAR